MTMTWELLNAYVDRELDPETAAAVAAAAAGDPALAARIATLARLKAATVGLASDQTPPALPRRVPAKSSRWRVAIAACLFLGLALGAVQLAERAPGEAHGLAAAVVAERAWLAGRSGAGQGAQDRVRVAVSGPVGTTLPDLSPAGLQLTYLSTDAGGPGGHGLFAGYLGPHGCRLGLWMARGEGGGSDTPRPRDRDGLLIRAWADAGTAFALLSPGMDPLRLDRLAEIVARLAAQQNHSTDEIRVALQDAGRTGAACRT